MKTYEIRGLRGEFIAVLSAENVRWVERGVDFQPNIFNGYHAVEFGRDNPPAVLNLPVGMSLREAA